MNVEALSWGLSHPGVLKFGAKHPRGVFKAAAAARALDKKSIGMVPGRLALGSTMVFHGYSKLKQEAREPTGQFMESLGFKPGKLWGTLTGLAEVFGGLTSMLGIGTRLGALAI